jgi:hypothetical protein
MINRQVLIGKVSPFIGKREIIVGNQDTTDIIDALIKNHYKYSNEYDKIFRYFDGGSVEETAYNVWQFLKEDFKYTIEPEKMQILRSPAAILSSNIIGIDCKGYATFANGVMDAYRRNTKKDFEIFYRFASYDPFDNTPQHVFSVVEENGTEYWIDPVLDQFDEKKQPYFYKDKKIKKMALVAMSGINKVGVMDIDLVDNLSTNTASSGSNWFETILNAAPSIIKALPGSQPTYGGYNQSYYDPYANMQQPVQKSTGISTNTLLLIGAAGVAAYFIFKKK